MSREYTQLDKHRGVELAGRYGKSHQDKPTPFYNVVAEYEDGARFMVQVVVSKVDVIPIGHEAAEDRMREYGVNLAKQRIDSGEFEDGETYLHYIPSL